MATNNAAEMIPRIALKGTLGVSGPLNSDYDALINKPQINGNELAGNKTNAELGIPTELADLTADADHRTVSDTEKETWNAKSDFSGSYNDLTDVPEDLVEDAEYVHTDNNYTSAEKTKLGDIESGAEVNVQADWNETDTSSDAYIQNKPTIPAAQVNSDWNASSGVAEILHKPTLGTAAAKDYTGSVLENSTDLVESGAVKTAIDNAISSVYKPAGNKACAELVSALLVASNLGNVYNMTDDGVTTADFVEGAGKAIEAGDNVVIVDIGSSVYKFDLLSGMVDLSNYVQKSSTSGLIKNDGTIDQTAYAKQNEMSVSTSGDQTTIQLKNGTSATVINAHQDISGKVDKEQGKGLSTNDYTTAEKEKLTAISTEANKVTASETNGNIQIDGTETTVYDDTELQGAVSDLEDDVEEIQGEITTETATIEGNPLNFSTKSAQNAKSTILSLEPIQDLHGYDKPWVGGAGRNLLSMTVDSIKSVNTSGTWNGNIYSYRGIDCEILVDNDNNVLGFKLTGTASSSNSSLIYLGLEAEITNGAIFSALGQGAGQDSYAYQVRQSENHSQVVTTIYGEEVTLTRSYKVDINIRIASGYSISNALMVYPMVRATTDTNPDFEPYTNVCGISGRTEVNLLGTNGKESTDPDYIKSNDITISFGQTVYGGTIDVESGVLTIDTKMIDIADVSWNYNSMYNFFFSAQGETDDMYDVGTIISSAYEYVGFVGNADMANLPIGKLARGGNTAQPTFKVKDTRYTDVPTWKTALTGQKIVYELKTPTTIQLTPHAISILKGVNYFSTDGDSISLTYRVGEFATLGDLEESKAETDIKIAESQILTDTETGKKYKLVVANGVLDIEEIIG